jgi:hypothetical protein
MIEIRKAPSNARDRGVRRLEMSAVGRALGSFGIVVSLVLGSLGTLATETGCSGSCSDDEAKKCDESFNRCTTAANTRNDLGACRKCADDYCECYDDCGSSCDRSRFQGVCNGALTP